MEALEPYIEPARRARRQRALLDLRRHGYSYDQIAEELGYDNKFEVIDELNHIYGQKKEDGSSVPRPDIREVIDYIDTKLDDLVSIYHPQAMEGNNIKAGNFTLNCLKLKADIHGAKTPPQVNVQINNEKPWQKVYAATLSDDAIEGDAVD